MRKYMGYAVVAFFFYLMVNSPRSRPGFWPIVATCWDESSNNPPNSSGEHSVHDPRLAVAGRDHLSGTQRALDFVRVIGLAFLALYSLAFFGWFGALIVLGVVVQWIRNHSALGGAHFGRSLAACC